MNKFNVLIFVPALTLALASCSQLLQTVNLDVGNTDLAAQEEFQVTEKTLTLANAKIANQDPYPRNVIRPGRGSSARPILESAALQANFPSTDTQSNYKIGAGDEIAYAIFEEDRRNTSDFALKFPETKSPVEYVIGPGDELTLLRVNEADDSAVDNLSVEREGAVFTLPGASKQAGVIATSGRVGSDGSILLLEVGRLEAAGKTLTEIQSEVRNILIRDGLSPRFQLELSGFASQTAILTVNLQNKANQTEDTANSKVITLTDRVAKLRDILAASGLGIRTNERVLVTLKRGSDAYHMTMRDVFNSQTPDVVIEDGDTIYVDEFQSKIASGTAIVMSEGTLVIPEFGRIKVIGSTIDQVRRRLSQKIKTTPNITKTVDLDVIGFASKNATIYLSTGLTTERSDYSTQIVPIGTIDLPLSIALTKAGVKVDNGAITQVTLKRDDKTYRFSFEDLIVKKGKQIFLLPDDQIFVDRLPYKENKVFALGGVEPKIINITPERRETLADALFAENGVLASDAAQRSDVYLLRGTSPVRAYRLDAQSPTRLIVADAMELRPNDILYVAEQPIVSFNRALERIIPLRTLIADIAGSTE